MPADRRAQPLARLILEWFTAGAWLGVIDAWVALLVDSGTAGGWTDRIGTLVVSLLVWGTTCVALRGIVSLPAAWLARRTSISRGAWSVGLVAGAVAFMAALIFLESLNQRLSSAPFLTGVAVCALAASLVAFATGLAADRIGVAADGSERRGGAWRWAGALCGAGLACVLVATLGWREPVASGNAMPPNLLLVSMDTLRADHLGVYGYDRPTSPNLDTLAQEGIAFERAYAPSQWCLPSHASMLTGLDVLAHGVRGRRDVLDDRHTTLAETLRANGYRTAAFIAGSPHGYVGADRGFDQGFDVYHHFPHHTRWRTAFLSGAMDHAYHRFVQRGTGNAEMQLDRVLRWVDAHRDRPFFLFVHLLDVHAQTHRLRNEAPEPFRDMFCPDYQGDYDGCTATGRCAGRIDKPIRQGVEPPLSAAHVDRIVCLYDGSIAYADHALGRFLEALDDRGLYDRTVIAVTADHGEEFMEHGVLGHAQLYDATLHVPLLLKAPNLPAGRVVEQRVRMIDVAPTLVELAGIDPDPPQPGQGRSLVALVRGEDEPGQSPPDIAVTSDGSISVRTDRVHYVHHEYPDDWVTLAPSDRIARDGGALVKMEADDEIPEEIREILRARGAEDLLPDR